MLYLVLVSNPLESKLGFVDSRVMTELKPRNPSASKEM